MSDFHLVDPQGWEYDLQSVYAAYIGHFQLHGVPWHDRLWGQYFETFEEFLAFSWPVITITDARTGRAHIVTRMASIAAFLKMIKSRYGETLPQVDNLLIIKAVETSQRHLWHVSDWPSYRRLDSALPAVALAAFKARVRGGDPSAIRELWAMRDKTFLALDFECLERSERRCVEWGYAAIRSGHLVAAGAWPPAPDTNYRKGHYIISEYVDATNKASSGVLGQYAFGDSKLVTKEKAPRILLSVLSSLASPDSDSVANNVVLIVHGLQVVIQRLDEMKIKLPSNMLMIDIAYFERALFNSGERGQMHDRKTGRVRLPEALLSLNSLLRGLDIDPQCTLHNAGNRSFMTLIAFQRMVDPKGGVTAPRVATGNGTGNGTSKRNSTVLNGHGHAKRVSTVASRIFRPLGGTHPDPPGPGTNGIRNGNGHRNDTVSPLGSRRSHDVRGTGTAGGVDEMGMMNTHMKRVSMFSTLRSPLMSPTDKQKKGSSNESTSGSGSAFGMWRLSSSTIAPGQRRHSTIEKQ